MENRYLKLLTVFILVTFTLFSELSGLKVINFVLSSLVLDFAGLGCFVVRIHQSFKLCPFSRGCSDISCFYADLFLNPVLLCLLYLPQHSSVELIFNLLDSCSALFIVLISSLTEIRRFSCCFNVACRRLHFLH